MLVIGGALQTKYFRAVVKKPTLSDFVKGREGIYVTVSGSPGRPDLSRVGYSHNNSIPGNVPFPDDATDIVYDENRPYLRCLTALSFEATEVFFKTGLAVEGWLHSIPR